MISDGSCRALRSLLVVSIESPARLAIHGCDAGDEPLLLRACRGEQLRRIVEHVREHGVSRQASTDAEQSAERDALGV